MLYRQCMGIKSYKQFKIKLLKDKEIKQVSSVSDKMFILIRNTIGLPKNLLPNDWPLPEAAGLFSKIIKKVD